MAEEEKTYDELYQDFINGRDVPEDFQPREIQFEEATERRKAALAQRHIDAIEDAKTGVNFDVGILTRDEIEKYRAAYLFEKYFQSESFRFQEFHAYPENLIIDLVTEDGPDGHMSLAGFAAKEVDKFNREKENMLIYKSFETNHKELLHFKRKNKNATDLDIQDFFRARTMSYEQYMKVYEDFRYLVDLKAKIIDLDKDYSKDSSYALRKSDIGSTFEEVSKYADAEFGYNNYGHPSIRYVWSVYLDLYNYRKKVDEGAVENPKTRQIRNKVCFYRFFEKDADGGYTQISDFGSDSQLYLDKRVDDLSNYRRVSSFTLALIAARAFDDMKEKFMFYEQLGEIYQILHINPEDKDSHGKHVESAIAVLRERIDQACKGELGEEYKANLFGTEMADQYLLKFKGQLERFTESFKIITPFFNSAVDTFAFELREAARLKREAEERSRIRREKLAKYSMIWGVILLAVGGYLAVAYNNFTAGRWVVTQRVVAAFIANEKRKFTSIAPALGNMLGATNVEYVSDPNRMPVGGLYDMNGNMLPNSEKLFETYIMQVDENGNIIAGDGALRAARGDISERNPDGIPYFELIEQLPKGSANQLQVRVIELEQALFFKEKDEVKLRKELDAQKREISLLMQTNRKLQDMNERFFPPEETKEITVDKEIFEPKSEMYRLMNSNKDLIINNIAQTNLNEKSSEQLFSEFAELANAVCPDGANNCGYITLIPSWEDYLQSRKVEKFGAIILNMDTKELELPF